MVTKAKAKGKPVVEDDADEDQAPVAKKKRGKSDAVFDITAMYNEDIDAIARRQGFEESTMDTGPAMSTGLLSLDLILNGGIRPAWYTTAGGEQSCKTTTAITIMGASVKAEIPIVTFADYEGSTANSRPYVQSIMRGSGVKASIEELFGKRDEKTGRWVIRPRVRYRAETIGDKFFDYLSEVLRNLPDKRYINKQWWFVFERTKVNISKLSEFADSSMAKKYGNGLWIPAPDGRLQAVFLTDSYPAMNPADNDEEDVNKGLALQARMFSKHLPRVKGRLAQKMVAVIGVNQIRAIPMARHGPTEQEPGGQALRFYSDVRIKHTSRSSGQPLWPNPKNLDDNYFETEKSITGVGVDRYRYIQAKAIKNKLGTPQRKIWYRLWHEDATGEARGFDPFFDTMHYLRETGQLKGVGRDKMTLHLDGVGVAKRPLKWFEMKQWVLGDKALMTEASQKAGFKPMSLRAYCFKQIASGRAEILYVAHKGKSVKAQEGEE